MKIPLSSKNSIIWHKTPRFLDSTLCMAEVKSGVVILHNIKAHVSVFTHKVRQYPMSEYDSKLDEGGKMFLAPRHHKVNMDGYLRSYLYSPTLYLLSVARARQVMEAHCSSEELQEMRLRGQREATGKDVTSNSKEGQTNTQKVKADICITMTTTSKHKVVVKGFCQIICEY